VKFIHNNGITSYAISLIDIEIAQENVFNGEEECVMIVEHEGVYSAGKSFESKDFIGTCKYPVYSPNRGGRVTVHNPGQIVVYPTVNLRKRDIAVSFYVKILENWMINVLDVLGIEANSSNDGIGVWVQNSKIGFIGIRVQRGVSSHGLCLNANNDLAPFDSIIPCGIQNLSVTSVSKILMKNVDIDEITNIFIDTCPF
jgi:lipoyl(octanoyl) transferase